MLKKACRSSIAMLLVTKGTWAHDTLPRGFLQSSNW